MIEETAMVVRIDGEYAFVETQRRAACGSCESQGSCSTTVLAGLFKRRYNHLRVVNTVLAKPGEQVIIGLQEQALVKLSMLAYLLPLISMILAAIAAQYLFGLLNIQSGELPQVIGGLLGLIGGFFLLRLLAYKNRHDPGYQAVMLRHADRVSVPFV
ncbi:MAG: SoxR reducing system RseC family protein [Candidatus Thiodiazotropha sp. (ex. Lucinisca nassula)]|nr:SoxR reducing system RseC family protein [Candidatus Thiodiazotropha taylori]MBW9256373.1 SoxR reducing system RseC family protein [Candidatus Thiodiazotropha sp. (ex. Lucinisca nassula)]MBW9260517.1 SoxR reducing system RseC family protein [Candidatus Thiodiazotropha sp. (ex. Lucinisca nassula)]MBW9268507.1 SoxR reducing system RseC family protein [Candidatus Thiodiazotropha sp. (ex. Lucinisca nassula)]